MPTTPGSTTISSDHPTPTRGTKTVGRRRWTAADDATIEKRLAACLACHYAHPQADGTHKCKKKCCGALANGIEKAIRFVEIRCPLKRPAW